MLIYLADLAHTYSTKNESLMVPLNIGFIKAYAKKQHGNNIDIKLFKNPDEFLKTFYKKAPHILGLSNYGWNADLNLKIGKFLKSEFPETIITAGGPNIDPDVKSRVNFLNENNYIDYLIVDGGEEPFSELINWFINNKKTDIPKNIIFLKKNGELFDSGRRPLTKDASNIISPYLTGYLDEFLDLNMVPLLETNRGCPFRCTFCAWGMASHDLVRRLDIDNTLQEIEYIGKRSKVNNWIICDANFGLLKRDVEIAKKIREIREKYQYPKKCHVWLAKNVTERNLEIGKILGDMTVPVMAIQSMEKEVLENVKRENISSTTYIEYQQKFHSIGSVTYSDLIVPLPGETFKSHLKGLKKLFDMGVDIIQNHNMRMLAGSEMNSSKIRKKYKFKTKYRLIHGDSGVYKTPNGNKIKSFEVEESLRSTNTMTEKDIFKLREIHFLIEFTWNFQVYSDLFKVAKNFKINQLDVILNFLKNGKKNKELRKFWKLFDHVSKKEWFNNKEEAQEFFLDKSNFRKLKNQEYEKINIQFSIIALRDYKILFDRVLLQTLRNFDKMPNNLINTISKIVFAQFPSLDSGNIELSSKINFKNIFKPKVGFRTNSNFFNYYFPKTKEQKKITNILTKEKTSISKILNTQGVSIRDLKRTYILDHEAKKNINKKNHWYWEINNS